MSREEIISTFPNLAKDKKFKISSKKDLHYNCIAWAGFRDDIVWWPIPVNKLDGISRDWPFGVYPDDKLKYLIEVFKKIGYAQESNNINLEENYRKVALYIVPDSNIKDSNELRFTHAARQLNNGLWTSKLGAQEDIEHTNPYDLEGKAYGKLIIILKKELK